MKGIERQYLRECINALYEARFALLQLRSEEALTNAHRFGKKDTLRLDAEPEHVITQLLCDKFDPHLPLVTEEIGSSKKLRGTEDEVICFADPLDRSKVLADFLEKHVGMKIKAIFEDKDIIKNWEAECGGSVEISGPYGSITLIRHHDILFNVMINYITGVIYVASDEIIGSLLADEIFEDPRQKLLKRSIDLVRNFSPISFGGEEGLYPEEIRNTMVAYCECDSRYEDNLVASGIFEGESIDEIRDKHLLYDKPGGPARILYLKNPPTAGFILSNGEKIGEWLGWLAYIRHCWPKLRAYEISFDSSWTRDQILMAPGPTYSILGDQVVKSGMFYYKKVQLNIPKLQYLEDPSRYRSTILICPESNEQIHRRLAIKRHLELRFL